jgi:hypothetical protein
MARRRANQTASARCSEERIRKRARQQLGPRTHPDTHSVAVSADPARLAVDMQPSWHVGSLPPRPAHRVGRPVAFCSVRAPRDTLCDTCGQGGYHGTLAYAHRLSGSISPSSSIEAISCRRRFGSRSASASEEAKTPEGRSHPDRAASNGRARRSDRSDRSTWHVGPARALCAHLQRGLYRRRRPRRTIGKSLRPFDLGQADKELAAVVPGRKVREVGRDLVPGVGELAGGGDARPLDRGPSRRRGRSSHGGDDVSAVVPTVDCPLRELTAPNESTSVQLRASWERSRSTVLSSNAQSGSGIDRRIHLRCSQTE